MPPKPIVPPAAIKKVVVKPTEDFPPLPTPGTIPAPSATVAPTPSVDFPPIPGQAGGVSVPTVNQPVLQFPTPQGPPAPASAYPISNVKGVSPDVASAKRDLNVAIGAARRAGVPGTKIESIVKQKEPNFAIKALGKVIGFDVIPGGMEFKPVEKLLLPTAATFDVGRRAVLSTLKEVGDEIAVYRGKRGRGEVGPEPGREYVQGPGGFSISDWWKQTNDTTLGYGGIVGNIFPDTNLAGRIANRTIGFTGDVLLDPVTWVAGPGGIAKEAVLEATAREGAQLAAEVAAREAAGLAPEVAAKAATEAATAAAQSAASKAALEATAKTSARRVLGARTREELAQIAREVKDVAVKSGNTRVAEILTDDVIGDIATRGYSAMRGPVAEVFGVKGGLRITNPAILWNPEAAAKLRILPKITEPFTNAFGTALTGIRVGAKEYKNVPRIFNFVNKGFVNTAWGKEWLRSTTPFGEGGLWGTQDLLTMRTSLRSGRIVDPITGAVRKLTGKEAEETVKLLAQDRVFRLIKGQAEADAIKLLAPVLSDGSFFKYSNTVSDLLENPALAADAIYAATPESATRLVGREVTAEELQHAQNLRKIGDEFWERANFVSMRQKAAAGIPIELQQDLYKNKTWFPHVLSDDTMKAINNGSVSDEVLKQLGIDRTFALAGSNPRELVVGEKFFGRKLTQADIDGGIKRLNEIANKGGFKGNFFETNAEIAYVKYGKSFAKDTAFSQYLHNMALAANGSGPWATKAFADDVLQSTAKTEIVKPPTTAQSLIQSAEDILSPERVQLLQSVPNAQAKLEEIQTQLADLVTKTRKGAADVNAARLRDQINYSIADLEQKILDLQRTVEIPYGYSAVLTDEAQNLARSLQDEVRGLELNLANVKPENWQRILPIYMDAAQSSLAINAQKYPGLIASPQVKELLSNMQRLEDPAFAAAVNKALGGTTQMFKSWVTATPGFHTRNALSNMFFMLSAGADPATLTEATTKYRAYTKYLKRLKGDISETLFSPIMGRAESAAFGIVPSSIAATDPELYNRLLNYQTRELASGLGTKGSEILDFVSSPEFLESIGAPKGWTPYGKSSTDPFYNKWYNEAQDMATVLQAQTTSGFGQVGAVFEQPGRRGVSGGVNTRTVRGAETLGQKVTGAASSLSRGLAYPLDLSKKAGNAIENWSRFALTYDGLRKGLTAEEAAARTAKYLIDYQDLSIADKNIKGLIPFWTWTSRSFPLIVESMWMNPKAYAVYNSAVRNLTDKNAEYFAPDYLSSGGAFPLPFGQNLLGTPDFGFQRQEEGLAKFTDPSSFLGGLAPIIRAPIEAGMNQRFQTGGQVYNPYYEEGAGKQLQYLLQQIFPQIPAVGKIVNPVVGAIQNPLPSTLGTAGAVAGGKIAGPAGAAVGGALGLGAGALANQALGEKISPIQKGLEAVAAAPQNIPTTLQNLFAIGKPDYIEKEKGKFTPNESMVKVLQFLGLPITVLQDYQQVQAIKDIVTQLEQVTSRQKNKRK